MALHHLQAIGRKIRGMDLFQLCLTISVLLHAVAGGAYFIANMPSFASDEDSIYDASKIKMKDVSVDFIDLPSSVPLGGDTNPAPVDKAEWIEGTGKDKPDAESTDIDINKLSGDGTDKDGYMFADLSDHPPIPIIDFDLNRYFPQAARSANITRKTVLLQMQVNEDGTINSAKIVSPPSGYGFDEAAMKVVARLRFRPGKVSGRAVKMLLRVPITFVLED
ncbi:MAG TPA: energy transducer TonB [Spirochaetota bacterium]|mgnify:CR=1 FL=1|nr:energy transducer TonB [Spirochaetota bacterium]HPC41722.1 energy transducer TonB [Spirochaetota bacterium]HPL18945.1 energy transducer TonB [Spirochaetota bacterium]HQF09253.1 energy transducer TonB [Spirochaetota bacterium]HQH98201.1 energy transducer TonB [Spirochaetota bacterium]